MVVKMRKPRVAIEMPKTYIERYQRWQMPERHIGYYYAAPCHAGNRHVVVYAELENEIAFPGVRGRSETYHFSTLTAATAMVHRLRRLVSSRGFKRTGV